MHREPFKPQPDDFIVLLMGLTGSGKTNFINSFTGNTEQLGVDNLNPDTQDVTPYRFSYQGFSLVLIDTPGFDNTYRGDTEILRVIADWLTLKYSDDTALKISGMIYFHRITDNHMSHSASKHVRMLRRVCGSGLLRRTRLVTTMWDQVMDEALAAQRETELIGDFWRMMIEGGASPCRFHNTPDSARDIVGSLLAMGRGSEQLLLQKELVQQQKRRSEPKWEEDDAPRNSMSRVRFKPDPDDFIILLMGPRRSGKTNFIHRFTGNTEHREANRLNPNTQSVTSYAMPYQGLRLVLVDTPGFDGTYREESKILGLITDWLTQKRIDGTTLKVSGIIYFHKITDDPELSANKNRQMLRRVCGNFIPLYRTRLVTTMWDLVKDQAVARQREAVLKDTSWRLLVEGGGIAHRFHNTSDSARDIVEGLLSMGRGGDEQLLQEGLLEQQRQLNDTEGGKVFYNLLQKLFADRKRAYKKLAMQPNLQKDPAVVKGLQEEYEEIDAQLQKTLEQMQEMKIPLSKRIRQWLLGRIPRTKSRGAVQDSSPLPTAQPLQYPQ